MDNNTVQKEWYNNKFAIVTCSVLIIVCLFAVILIPNIKFNQLAVKGDKLLSDNKYAEAITVFKQAKKYRNKQEIDQKISQAEKFLKSEKMFQVGMADYNAKDYPGAVNAFEKVIPEDKQHYKTAQKKIKEANQQLAHVKINKAKELFSNNDFRGAYYTLQDASDLTDQPLAEVTTLLPIYQSKKEQQEENERIEAEKQARKEAIEKMNQYEVGIGTVGIAVTEVKTSSTVHGNYGYYRYVNDPKNDQFVWVCIAAYNMGSNTTHVNPNYFTLSTKDGYTANYDVASFDTNYLKATNLSSNTYCTGWLVFIVPKANEYTLHFNSLDSSIDKNIIM